MEINILHLIEGAKQATGLTVIIDVFRAFSVACYAFAQGAENIIPVGNIDDAYALKKSHPDRLLIGERGGAQVPGFNYGNSPSQIQQENFYGKIIIHTTSSGTQGIVNATHADEIITGSFVNAQAIINYIKNKSPETVSLVAMGDGGKKQNPEDILCVEYIKNALTEQKNNFSQMVTDLKNDPSTKRFFNPTMTHSPAGDFDLCLALDSFDFVLKVVPYEKHHVLLEKIS